MSRARTLLASFLCLPLAASALVILSAPPASRALSHAARHVVSALAAPVFDLIARLPPDSFGGRLFYGSYEALVPIFGSAALAVHAALLASPALLAAILLWRKPRRVAAR